MSRYGSPETLADVMALIQVLAQAHNRAIRSETGLVEELQGKPTSKNVDGWVALARSHPEFFRVNIDSEDKTPRVSLIARHVLANNDQGKRPALSQEATSMLLELAISLHDRERATQEALKAWVQRMHAFLLSFFVTVENKRLVNPTPKRKVARWNRAGGTSFPTPNLFVSYRKDLASTKLAATSR